MRQRREREREKTYQELEQTSCRHKEKALWGCEQQHPDYH